MCGAEGAELFAHLGLHAVCLWIEIRLALAEKPVHAVTHIRGHIQVFEKSEVNEFDFILMDIMMPKLNGLDATRKIRALKRLDAKTIPIIAMSANAFVEDVMLSLIHISEPTRPY